MILTVTGPSASGKTSLARALRLQIPGAVVLNSTTTRGPRPSDLPGEYRYETQEGFSKLKQEDAFIWTVEVHGNRYGTRKDDVDAVMHDRFAIGILTIDAVAKLREYLGERGALDKLLSVYLDIVDERMLHARLNKRGDSKEDIELRINECRSWAKQRDASGVPFMILDAREDSSFLAQKVIDTINNPPPENP